MRLTMFLLLSSPVHRQLGLPTAIRMLEPEAEEHERRGYRGERERRARSGYC